MKKLMLLTILFIGLYLTNISANNLEGSTPLSVVQIEGNTYRFTMNLPELRLSANGKIPFYSYFVELGNGDYRQGYFPDNTSTFSFDYTYTNPPIHDVSAKFYNNYGQGNRPEDEAIASPTININGNTSFTHSSFLNRRKPLSIQPGFIPREFSEDKNPTYLMEIDDEFTFVIAYKNTFSSRPVNGKLMVLYNQDGLNCLMNTNKFRTYYNERIIENLPPQALPERMRRFTGAMTWQVDNFPSNKERHLFLDLKALGYEEGEEADIAVVFIPDNQNPKYEEIKLLLVNSRDPNRLKAKRTKGVVPKYDFKVQFFNEANGQEDTITIRSWDHNRNWNLEKVELTKLVIGETEYVYAEDLKYFCNISYVGDTVVFSMTRAGLQGAKSPLLKKKKEAHGYIKFKVEPKKDWKTSKNQSYIMFGKQKPIYTNKKKLNIEKKIFLGIEGSANFDFINKQDTAWNFRNSLEYIARGRAGLRLTDRFFVLSEFGLGTNSTFEDGQIVIDRQSLFITPMVGVRPFGWLRLGLGVNITNINSEIYGEDPNNPTGIVIVETVKISEKVWIADAQIALIDNRLYSFNIGSRFRSNSISAFNNPKTEAYATLRLNIIR